MDYAKKIRELLDQAAGDKSLTTEQYAELCSEVATDAEGRHDAARADLERDDEDGN
jgi:hypothetical protein